MPQGSLGGVETATDLASDVLASQMQTMHGGPFSPNGTGQGGFGGGWSVH